MISSRPLSMAPPDDAELNLAARFAPFAARMRAERLPEIVIQTFEHYYRQLVRGETGLIAEAAIEPVRDLPDAEAFADELAEIGRAAAPHTVLIKLNGGLGTGMGLEGAKSLLVVKQGLTFLDITARQALRSHMPLVLMNSYNTRDDSLTALRRYPALWGDIPLDFLQHKTPKVMRADLTPAIWPAHPELEWHPPGHGDIYTALITNGLLATLLDRGYRYAFVSNADNLGAVVDETLLGYFVREGLPFMMEVADRTPADRKGGHLARRRDGQLILRELAQCPADDVEAFQDIDRHRYFNTNNLWIDLRVLSDVMKARDNILGLPLIRNAKTLDPRDATSPAVYQLETAMGAAIAVFAGAGAVRVPRSRFAPVKTTDDLLAVRSDAYVLTDDFRVIPNPARDLGAVDVQLDPAYYRLVDEMDARFPHGAPSLVACRRLKVVGDITFGRDVTLRGDVKLHNPHPCAITIPDGAVIEGDGHASEF